MEASTNNKAEPEQEPQLPYLKLLKTTVKKISEVATQAKDYVSEKVSVVGDKIKDLQNADLGELADNAKEYARRNPGQAILISAAAGLFLGLILRGRR